MNEFERLKSRKGMKTTLLRKVMIFTIFVIILFLAGCSKKKEIPYLVMISFDGFRWDYADSCNTPFLDYMAHTGVKAEYLEPGFPTVTFPNHYAIATGLYPGNCGLVHNNFYDKKTGRFYSIGNRAAVEDSTFYKGIPLWNLLQQHNIKTGTCFWVGSEAPVNGMYANNWMKYNGSLPFKSRIDTIIAWLRRPVNERPHLVMAYFSEPDHIGHEAGPNSPETKSVVENMDSLLGYFFTQFKKTNLRNKLNIIVLSDHGMANVDSSQNIVLNNYIRKNWIDRQTGGSACYFIEPAKGFEDSIISHLQNIGHLRVFRRDSLPEKWHLNDTNRIEKLVVVADNGYVMRWDDNKIIKGGNHGYDNKEPDMRAIFYATGPVFKRNYSHPGFSNTDIYSLVSEIFAIKPPHNDGNFKNVKNMLAE